MIFTPFSFQSCPLLRRPCFVLSLLYFSMRFDLVFLGAFRLQMRPFVESVMPTELRVLCTERPDQATFWYILGSLVDKISPPNDKRLYNSTFKFSSRLLRKAPNSLPCILTLGNNLYSSGSYR